MTIVFSQTVRIGLTLLLTFFAHSALVHAQDTELAEAPSPVTQVEQGAEVDEGYALVRIQTPAESVPPEGWTLTLGQGFGDQGRVQLGTAWWLNHDWAVGFDIGFDYVKREFRADLGQGSTELVERVESVVTPQLSGMYTLMTAGSKRLLLAAAVGPYFSKPEGESTGVGVAGHVGPGIDWPLSPQLSLHFQQRIAVTSDPDPEQGFQMGLQPYFSAVWWF